MDALKKKLSDAGVSQSAYNKAVQQATGHNKQQRLSLTDLKSGLDLAAQGLRYVQAGYDATVGAAQKYAGTVRDLSAVSGTSAEESSRLLQVLDDFQVSAEDVNTAVRKMTQQGLVPTTESLAQLSDEYLAINDPMERNKFILDNLGKSGLQWTNVLKQGGDAIRQLSDGVSENLILTNQEVTQMELWRLKMDSVSDSIEGMKIQLGIGLVGVLDGSTAAIQKHAQELFKQAEGYEFNSNMTGRYTEAQQAAWKEAVRQATEQHYMAEGIDTATESFEDQTDAVKEDEEAIKAISDANQQFLRVLGDVGGELTTYKEGVEEVNEQFGESEYVTDLYKQRLDELLQTYRDGDSTQKEYLDGVKELQSDYQDGTFAAQEQQKAVSALGAEYQAAKDKIVLSIVEMKLAQDGWTNEELGAYLKVGEQLGVFTQDQIAAASAAVETADNIIAGYSGVTTTMDQMYASAASMGEAVGTTGTGFTTAATGAGLLATNTGKANKVLLDAKDPIKHIGERAANAGDGFGIMASGAGKLAEVISSEALPAVAGLKSQILGLPKSGTQWNYAINIDVSGSVPGNLPPSGGGGGAINVGGGILGGACFVAGTLVAMADGSLARIEDVRVDDEIRSWHDGEFITVKVEKTFHHLASETPQLVKLNGVLIGTPEHLIYVGGDWLPLGFLHRGEALLIDGKPGQVTSIEPVPGFVPVYNLETNHESHNYFANGILVHNGKATGGTLNPGAFTIVGEGAGGWSPTAEVVYNGMVIPHTAAQWMKDAGMLGGSRGMASGGSLRGENLLPPTRDKDELDQVRIEQNEIQESETAAVAETIASFVSADIQQATAAQSVAFSNFMSASTAATAEQTVILKQILNKLPSARDEATAIRENALKDF
jgi:hypothetical protein